MSTSKPKSFEKGKVLEHSVEAIETIIHRTESIPAGASVRIVPNKVVFRDEDKYEIDLYVEVTRKYHTSVYIFECRNRKEKTQYLVVQKNVQQGFLDLFRFYWNHRNREWGRGKGTSPYEALTGQRVDDWLTLLGYPPSEDFAAAS